MDPIQWFVTGTGLLLAAAVLWYFFGANAAVGRAIVAPAGQRQSIDVVVEGGYSPAVVELRAGQPARLNFIRREDSDCSAELLIPDLRIRRELPAFQTTALEIPPVPAGTYPFSCGMGMLKGRLVVK